MKKFTIHIYVDDIIKISIYNKEISKKSHLKKVLEDIYDELKKELG